MSRRLRLVTLVGSVCLAGTLAGCVYQQPYARYPAPAHYPAQAYPSQPAQGYATYPGQRVTEYGVVSYIEGVQPHQRPTSGVGTVLGAVVGGVLGNQIGRGFGRAAATTAGAVGGALAGNAIEGQNRGITFQAYRITVQLDQGGQRVYEVPSPGHLRPGDRVSLYDGQIARI
ncbi:MAG TPA: glycine zipper 2TM domain-containing protein [Alicycliphilus sp.]|nr:glycine zipper 2TM domain-containing protein [Alicycliphilus sp.]